MRILATIIHSKNDALDSADTDEVNTDGWIIDVFSR